jgi:hemoglobin
MSEQNITADQIYHIIGPEGFQRVVSAFYRRVAEDDILRPMYPRKDLAPAERRLRLFLEQYFGGPTTYSQERGHPRLRMRHMHFPIDQQARDRWVQLMLAALEEADFPEAVAEIMRTYFEQAASFLINQHPDRGGMFSTPYTLTRHQTPTTPSSATSDSQEA